MISPGDDAGVILRQPKLVLPEDSIDKETDNQTSPQTLPEPVDSALLELIQSVQHELRTPLHGMLALLSSLTTDLKKQIKGSENEQRLDDINSLGGQLLSVLDDFRDFASHTIEAKAAEEDHQITPNEEADLSEILDDLASEVWDNQVAALKAAKGPDVRIPPPPELILTLDPSLRSKQSLVSVDSFRKVARKLIDNALKFTPGVGFVEISLAPHRMQDVQDHTSKEPTKNYIRLTVEDTGKGMTNEFVSDKLFAPFAKADSFKSGAGLSMALCSSLVRRMGGSMQVSSDKDRGTTIIVLIPAMSVPDTNASLSARRPSTAHELVYFYRFDDMGLQRLAGSIASQLATYGNLYTTTRVEEADYVLIPEEKCYGEDNDALEELMAQTKEGVKVAVLQAHEDAKIEMTVLKNGSPPPVYVTRKPFGPRSFARLIAFANKGTPDEPSENGSRRLSIENVTEKLELHDFTETSTEEESHKQDHHTLDLIFTTGTSDEILRGTPPATRLLSPLWEIKQHNFNKPPRKISALCVEDNPLNMRILTKVLSQCNLPFYVAVDGVEAVEVFEKNQPALVLLDINMPKMDGYEACIEMRKKQQFKSYIMAVTALSDDYSKKRGLEVCGMDEWLSKPLDIVKFRDKIKSLHQAFKEESSLSS